MEQKDKEKELELLYKQNFENFVRYADTMIYSRNGSKSDCGRAQEAVQEAFVFALEHLDDMFDSPKPLGWLFKVIFFKCCDMIADDRQWVKRIVRYEANYQEELIDQIDSEIELEGIVPTEDFKLLKRFYIEGFTYKELCEELGLSSSALGMKIKRIKEKFLRAWNENEKN